MKQSIDRLIDVCNTYQSMSGLTKGALYLSASGQLDVGDVGQQDRLDILWWLREVERFLALEQDTVRMDIEELRIKLERGGQ